MQRAVADATEQIARVTTPVDGGLSGGRMRAGHEASVAAAPADGNSDTPPNGSKQIDVQALCESAQRPWVVGSAPFRVVGA
jgi:hypothetical protein